MYAVNWLCTQLILDRLALISQTMTRSRDLQLYLLGVYVHMKRTVSEIYGTIINLSSSPHTTQMLQYLI